MKTLSSQNGEIRLAPISSEDASSLFSIVNNNRTIFRRWFSWIDDAKTINDTKKYIEDALKQIGDGTGLYYTIHYKRNIVGVIAFIFIHKRNKKAHIGYWLDQKYNGHGIMTKACQLLIAYGFEELHLSRVEIGCAVENTKSCAIPERLGFVKEGVIRDSEWLYDHFVDHNFYGLLKKEWRNKPVE